MDDTEYLYSGNAWFKNHLQGPDGRLWRKARRLFLFNNNLSSALNLFKFNYKAIQVISRPEGTVLLGSRQTELSLNQDEYRPGQSWADDAKNSILTLLDRIVTRWRPNYLNLSRINTNTIHYSLIPLPLRTVPKIFDDSENSIENFDADRALENYRACLVPLHYHELWNEIVQDFKNVDITLEQRKTRITAELFYDRMTLDEEHETALIFGTNRATFTDDYKPLSRKPGLFDIVLVEVNNDKYFGMIVHVEQIKVKIAEKESSNDSTDKNLKFDLQTTLGIYASRQCSDAIQENQEQTNDKTLYITKISNITSSRRMISAINNLNEWPQYKSLLKPMTDDPYFQLPQDYDSSTVMATNGLNLTQSKIITIAEHMFEDLQDHLHLVHGPPGTGKSRTIAGIVMKLLPSLKNNKKILLCAPSNNACDELARRILNELNKQEDPVQKKTLVRIGCQPPDDYRLCGYFLDFMILQKIVDMLKAGENLDPKIVSSTQANIMRHAKIVISTLNYCGSARMHYLKKNTAFIIVDEASQSLEADLLLPLRFSCTKIMLVGDPYQLPPCVLSDAGKTYGLSQSLYQRLYSIFDGDGDGTISMLNKQYRMHSVICRFPSQHFYSNRLTTDPSVDQRMRHITLKPLFAYNMINKPHDLDNASSSFNIGEAQFIGYFCRLLISHLAPQVENETRHGKQDDDEDDDDDDEDDEDDEDDDDDDEDDEDDEDDDDDDEDEDDEDEDEDEDDEASSSVTFSTNSRNYAEDYSEYEEEAEETNIQPISMDHPHSIKVQQQIVVITPYKAQVRLLRQYLPPYIEVMTVDSAQGKEKDIVILSCVRSGSTIGFLDDMHRVNVMLTRSKRGLYVVGNLRQLANQHASWKAFLNHVIVNRLIVDVNEPWPDVPYRE